MVTSPSLRAGVAKFSDGLDLSKIRYGSPVPLDFATAS